MRPGAEPPAGRGPLRVLLVEDDRELRAMLRDALAVEGYSVITAASLSEAMAIAHAAQPSDGAAAQPRGDVGATPVDLVLLDLGLPDGDGEALLATLRRRYNLPVLVISAREADTQKIRLLDAGADDYLVKPFGVGELLARMRVALRHRGTTAQAAVTRYRRDTLDVDLTTRSVKLDANAVHLTPTEFELLARLVRHAGQVVTHRQLLADVWGAEFVDHTHYLRLYMQQLRAKLEAEPAAPRLLLTEPGVGYRIAEPDDDA